MGASDVVAAVAVAAVAAADAAAVVAAAAVADVAAVAAPVVAADACYSIPDAIQRHPHRNPRNDDVVAYVLSALVISVVQFPEEPISVLALYDWLLLQRHLHLSLHRQLLLCHFVDECLHSLFQLPWLDYHFRSLLRRQQ
uniref:Putative secreted protein n=1 Tax=Anopheles darlingi TaxID=43151 RepID=A0A2M4D6G8_ANODA